MPLPITPAPSTPIFVTSLTRPPIRCGRAHSLLCMTAWMSWSTGKDSTYALHVAREELGIDVVALLTTISADHDRVSMHAVRRQLLERQAEALGLPLRV